MSTITALVRVLTNTQGWQYYFTAIAVQMSCVLEGWLETCITAVMSDVRCFSCCGGGGALINWSVCVLCDPLRLFLRSL